MNTEKNIDLKEMLIADFKRREQAMNGEAKTPFHQTRRQALARFEELGFPTPKHEEWKYSNVKNLLKTGYGFEGKHSVSAATIEEIKIPNLEGNVLYFVNGKYESELSTIVSPASQISIMPLREALDQRPEVINKYFGKIADGENDAFTALNTAFAGDGLFVHVPDGKVVDAPVVLYFISDTRAESVGAQPRNLFVVGKNAQVQFTETFLTLGDSAAFTNAVTEIYVGRDAHVQYYKVQNDSDNVHHVGTTQVQMDDNSHFYAATASLNGGFIRNNLNILIGEHCDAHMYGLYFPDAKQHIDNHTVADHRKPNSESNELYKGVLRGQSTGVFNGKIFVQQDAQKTNAFQSCKNVVLSPDATMNSKPQLEIWADDVKCSHGTTTGQLDDEALFYLRSRGISKAEALSLLMFAFCEDVITQIKIEPIRTYLEGIIAEKLA